MKRTVPVVLTGVLTALFVVCAFPCPGGPTLGAPAAMAQERGWKGEYDSVCSKTDVAMTLSPEELKALVARCDRLKPQIEAEEESTRKVYLRRLQMCRDLYQYVLESKEAKP